MRTCEHCQSGLSAGVTVCPLCGRPRAGEEAITSASLGEPGRSAPLGEDACGKVLIAGEREDEREVGSRFLDLSSLQKNVENDEASQRTRAIHRTFRRVMIAVWLLCLLGCVDLSMRGETGKGFQVGAAGLFFGPVVGAVAAFIYAGVISPGPDISGAEELRRRSRKARRSARARPAQESDNSLPGRRRSAPEGIARPGGDGPSEPPTNSTNSIKE